MFPDFNIFSVPLLMLIVQGLILVGLLLYKSGKNQDVSTRILAILLLLTCYHRITYTIGFMGWYDTHRNTKINYYLISLLLGVGPLIYLYIKSVGVKGFRIDKKAILHFVPMVLYVVFCIGIFAYDVVQDDFAMTQNGVMMQWVIEHVIPLIAFGFSLHLLLYLIFSFREYYRIRASLEHQFSNTYAFEMLWFRNFLYLFTFLFIYDVIQMVTNGFIFNLHWTQEWWYEFFSLVIVIYIGVKGYFTPIENLPRLEPELLQSFTAANVATYSMATTTSVVDPNEKYLQQVQAIVQEDKLYLDSTLTLTKLARRMQIPPSQLSQVINQGMGQNFNEFINSYRVVAIKAKLQDTSLDHLSILAVALDTGFNSKATFNRVFKKIDGHPPSFYRGK